MLFFGSWKLDPDRTDIGPYSPSASYGCGNELIRLLDYPHPVLSRPSWLGPRSFVMSFQTLLYPVSAIYTFQDPAMSPWLLVCGLLFVTSSVGQRAHFYYSYFIFTNYNSNLFQQQIMLWKLPLETLPSSPALPPLTQSSLRRPSVPSYHPLEIFWTWSQE